MRIVAPFLLLWAAATQALPLDNNANEAATPAPLPLTGAAVASAVPTITSPPDQIEIELEKRQNGGDTNTTTPDTTPQTDVTSTVTVTNLQTVTNFATVTAETTVASTVTATSTAFTTVTETASNVDTATLIVYQTTTLVKRWLDAEPTGAPAVRAFDDYHMQPRGLVHIVKRATVFVTVTNTKQTTVSGTTTATARVVSKTTVWTTIESTITTTTYKNAKTTVTTTSLLTVTSTASGTDTVYTEPPTGTSSTTGGSSTNTGSSSNNGGSSGGLSTGAKVGIGVGVGVAALAVLGALVFWFIKRRANRPEPEWYDPHTDLNNTSNMPDPTVPSLSPGGGPMGGAEMADTGGYRGAAGPAAAGAVGVAGRSRKSWAASTSPTVSPPSRYTTPADAPYPTGASNTPAGGYADMPEGPAGARPMGELDGGQATHPVEADSRPVVFEAPDRRYT